MSIREKMMEDCAIVDRTTASDGRGGVTYTWTVGATIKAAIAYSSPREAKTAEALGVTSLYTILTPKTVNLQYHDVVRRAMDGKIFRVTSDGDDNRTPDGAGLDLRLVTAEEWMLTSEITEAGNGNNR